MDDRLLPDCGPFEAGPPVIRPPCVLVMDEYPGIVKLIREILEADHFGTIGSSELDEGPWLVQRVRVDLFVLDLGWHGTTRMDLLQRLRLQGYPDTPAIGTTASSQRAEEAREAGLFAAVMGKPFEPEKLLAPARHLTGWSGVEE